MSSQKISEKPFASQIVLRTVAQRCTHADVVVEGQSCGVLQSGLLLLIGFGKNVETLTPDWLEEFASQSPAEALTQLQPVFQKWWDKISQLRIFSDSEGRINESLLQQPESSGLYLVSQFTLFADLRKGNRPSFSAALEAAAARRCFELLLKFVTEKIAPRPIFSGVFAADMKVSLVNDGPLTILFDCSLERGIEAL